jgi:signal transduction histidine kinase/ActR/RegA family two-component response regulator
MHSDDEDQALRSVALQNAQTILRARQRAEQELIKTKEALEEERRILELLNQTGAKLSSKLDLHSVAQTVTDAAIQLSGAQFGAFFYATSDADALSLYTPSADSRDALERFGLPRTTPILAPTLRGDAVIRLADVHEDARFASLDLHDEPQRGSSVCSYLAVPVFARSGSAIGGLLLGHGKTGVFTERSERLVIGIAVQAAIAIDNARLYEDAKRSADERARLLEAERAARVEIERISLVKDEFLATLSHELRTPLNAVLGWSGVLLSRTQDPEVQRGLETIARNARAQAQLIDDLLDMNRIVSGKIRLDVQRLELAAIVEAALDSVRPSAEAKAIAVRRTIDPSAGLVFGDPNRLQQVVWNLLTNAVKFTPKGGKIDVIVQRVDSHVQIDVRDTGMGISAEFLPHLFERFRQADSSTTRKYGGLGLGLSIVKQLVELHGGSVGAESGGKGQGATFTVALPLRAVRDSAAPSGEHPTSGRGCASRAPPVSLAGLTVLIVDDEPDARELVRSVLSEAGADVVLAASAAEGLACVQTHRPDLLVSDIGMPDRDGYQFIRSVRDLGSACGGRTPAIALTAFARSEDRTRAMLAGYQVHMSKPIEPQELVATISSLAANQGDRSAARPAHEM